MTIMSMRKNTVVVVKIASMIGDGLSIAGIEVEAEVWIEGEVDVAAERGPSRGIEYVLPYI